MKAEERRKELIRRLQGASEPLSASRLAAEFGVSRQVIVQDIALLQLHEVILAVVCNGTQFVELFVYSIGHYPAPVQQQRRLWDNLILYSFTYFCTAVKLGTNHLQHVIA